MCVLVVCVRVCVDAVRDVFFTSQILMWVPRIQGAV